MEYLAKLFANAAIDLPITFFGALIAYLAGRFVFDKIKEIKYGGWIVRILDDQGKEATRRIISPGLAERILNDPNEMSVFIKGVASPHSNKKITGDPVNNRSLESGLLVIGDEVRRDLFMMDDNIVHLDLDSGEYKRVIVFNYKQNNKLSLEDSADLPELQRLTAQGASDKRQESH